MIRNNDFTLEYIGDTPCLLTHGQSAADRKKSIFLNNTGVFIWNLLSKDLTIEEIFDSCYEHFEIDEADRPDAKRSIQSFMDSLCYSGMVIDTDFYKKLKLKKYVSMNIAGICVNLFGKEELFDDSFMSFADDEYTCSADKTQNIYVYHIAPVIHKSGELIIRDKEVSVIKTCDKYILIFPLWEHVDELHISPDGQMVSVFVKDTDNAKEEVFWAIRHAFLYMARIHNLFAIHSVSVEYDHKALLFSAGSGIGKSTHAALWNRLYGVRQINGDLNLLGKGDDGKIYAYGMPWCGTSGIYDAKDYELKGIVLLRQDPKNFVSHLQPEAKALAIMNRIISPMWNSEMSLSVIRFAQEVSADYPVWNYSCNTSDDAAAFIKSQIDSTTA